VSTNRLKEKPRKAGENRLLWGVPLTEHLFSAFYRKWLDLKINPDRVMTMGGIYLPDAHNKMIEYALDRRDWDALVWLEHDHAFPPHFVDRLAGYSDDIDIAGQLYFGRSASEPWPMAGMWKPEPAHVATAPNARGECDICGRDVKATGRKHVAQPYGMRYLKPSELIPMLEEMGLYEVDFVPSGFTFIRRHVLEKWPDALKPIYRTVEDTDDSAGAGDDVRFAKLAGQQGYRIWLDTWCPVAPDGSHLDVKHLTSFELGRDYWWDRIKFQHYENLHNGS
jgi:hypothetical protein